MLRSRITTVVGSEGVGVGEHLFLGCFFVCVFLIW